MTLRDLGKRTGLSVSFLSQVERGTSSLTLSSLARIADALQVRVGSLFEAPQVDTVVTRVAARKAFRLETSPVTYVRLGMNGPEAQMASLLIELAPCTPPSGEPFCHKGQEFVFVLKGRLLLLLEGDEHLLGPGDAIQFSAEQVHNWSNPDTEPMQAIWVTTERLFDGHA
jgi:transcriptional regulator with XRE-family HTH domain